MAEKIKKPIPQLQQLRRLSYNCNAEIAKGNASSRAPELEEMQLEKVIGTSSKSTNSLQVNPATGDICYLAGSHLVIYSPRDAKQVKFLPSRTTRPFQCVRFSSDGKYLAAGESAYRLPQITIWEIAYEEIEQIKMLASPAESANVSLDSGQAQVEERSKVLQAISYTEIKHLKGHKYGIETVLFSPKNDFLISLGDVNDKGLFVWDWRNETKISQNKLSKPVLLLEISPQQDFFVTGGYSHLKFWYLNEETGQPNARKLNDKSPAILESVSADLTKVKQQCIQLNRLQGLKTEVLIFVGISILGSKVFVLTSEGHIYVFDKQRKMLKWMNIKVSRAFGCSAQEGRLYCSCADGTIRIFATDSLQHLLSLSKPPPLGSTNLLAGNGRIKIQQNKSTKFADVIATAIDSVNNRAIALYSDRMMFVWDVAELKSVTVLRSMYSHSGPIHDIQIVPNKFPIGLNQKAMSHMTCQNEESLTKFVTCSSDRTIRFWNMIDPQVQKQKHQEIYQCLAKNAYSKDMSHMIFVTSALRESQDPQDINSDNPKTPYDHFKAMPLDRGEDGQLIDPKDQSVGLLNDKVDSIRCIRISPDGHHLASGDEVGNIRIHDLYSNELSQIKFLESHDCEVISLAYSTAVPTGRQRQPQTEGEENPSPTPQKRYLLASGGRDKQVLVYDSEQNYEAFMNLDHHSSTITSLQFNEYSTMDKSRLSGSPSYQKHIELISSSADRNLISKHLDLARFQIYARDLDTAALDTENPLFKLTKTAICKDKILSMDVARQAQYLITGHDKSLCLWKLPMFEKVWEKRVATREGGEEGREQGTNQVQLRVLIDDYASVIVSSSTSKRVTIYEAATGKPLCRAQPGQITTAMCFSNNMKHLITTSDNGLIFIWRLPEKIAQCLYKVKIEAQSLEDRIERIKRAPEIIEEVEENEELGDSHGPQTKQVASAQQDAPEKENLKSQEQEKAESDQDFDFEVPDKLKVTPRDNTFVKRRKEQVVDVLADIKKATNFIDGIVEKQTPRIQGQEKSKALKIQKINSDDAGAEEEDDEATEVKAKYPFKANRQYDPIDDLEEVKDESSLPGQRGAIERQQSQVDANLSDGGSDTGITPGEIDPNQDEYDPKLIKQIEQKKYAQRFGYYGIDDDASRMEQIRRSSEMWGRKSISSKLMMRRSSTFVPSQNGFSTAQVNDSAQRDDLNQVVDRMRTQSEQQAQTPILFSKLNQQNQPQLNSQFASKDPVTDIVDDVDLIRNQNLQAVKPEIQANPPAIMKATNPIRIESGKSVIINDFDASLEKQNNEKPLSPKKPETSLNTQVKAKQKRTSWGESGTLNSSANTDLFKTDKKSDVPFKAFKDVAGKQIDTRPTIIDDPNFGLPKSRTPAIEQVKQNKVDQQEKNQPQVQRQRSPIKRLVDKMFGTSPDKKKIGMSQVTIIGPPPQQIAEPPKVNIGNFKINTDYIKEESKVGKISPTMKSTPALFQGLRVEQRDKTEISPISTSAKSNMYVKSQTQRLDLNKSTKEYINEETKFNQSLQAEIDAINASLCRINGLVAEQKLAKTRDTKSLQESQNANDISMELKGLQVTKVNDTVGTKLFESMQNWNSMVKNLQESTDFDIQKISQTTSRASGYSTQNNMLLNLDQSQLDISQAQSMAPRSQAASSLSQISIKDDARDLLEKYSQLLLESIQVKLQQTTQNPPQ